MSTYDFSPDMPAGDVHIDRNMHYHWMETARWARIIAIISFVMLGIGVFGLLGMSTVLGSLPRGMVEEAGLDMLFSSSFFTVIIVIGLIATAIGGYINYRQLLFANRLKAALNTNNQSEFDLAWNDLRMVFRIYGYVTIAYIVLYIAMLAFFGSMMMRMFAPGEL